MESLSCYSLYESKITAGITVNDFESIVTVSPDTIVVKHAAIQTEPVVDKISQKNIGDFRHVAGVSLSFLHEVVGKSTKSKTSCLLAVDPTRWRLAADAVPAAVIDPCGLRNHVILLLRANSKYVLISRDNPYMVVAVDKDGKPVIQTMNRASLMLAAITNQKPTIAKPARCLVTV